MSPQTETTFKEKFNPDVLSALSDLQFRTRYIVEGYLNGINKSPFHGYSSEFREYRDYQAGDDLRRLDWRLYARADRLCIRRYEQETNLQFYVLPDTSKSMSYGGSRAWCHKLDYVRLISASLTWLMLNQRDSAGLFMMEDPGVEKDFLGNEKSAEPELCYLKASQKPSQLGNVFRHLEAVNPVPGPCLHTVLEHCRRLVRRKSVIVILSDLFDPSDDIKDQLKQLRFFGHELLVFHILDPDEQDFPFQEGSIFQDMENGVRRRISPNSIRQKYIERITKFFEDYQHFFTELGVSYTLMPTTTDPTRALAHFLAQRKLFI